mmetsp:Transcript_26021/g.32465  ORF Transcript_26021/g.32465 Transcript_26021/m.32465 type:complete len:130 (-) Transcript_26021:46-435(-)
MDHAAVLLDPARGEAGIKMPQSRAELEERAQLILNCYHACLEQLGLDESMSAEELSFNMWVTPRMMLVVRRVKEFAMTSSEQRVDINTLGFVGTLAVKSEASLEALKADSPIDLLKQVAVASSSPKASL